MKIVNLTPHPLNFYKNGQGILTIESSGFVRATVTSTQTGVVNGFPISNLTFGQVEGMPEPKKDTIYIVSKITADALKEQGRMDDIFITDKAVRDQDGKIIGCEGLAQV